MILGVGLAVPQAAPDWHELATADVQEDTSWSLPLEKFLKVGLLDYLDTRRLAFIAYNALGLENLARHNFVEQ